MKITILSPVHSKADKQLREAISQLVSYKEGYWKQTQFCKKQIIQERSVIDGRNGEFLTGLVPAIEKYCKRKKIELKIERNWHDVKLKKVKPKIKGIEFRGDQKKLIDKVIASKRGVILSATGTGKTILTMALISAYPKARVLFLCHNKSIVHQTAKEFKEKGFTDVGLFGGGIKDRIGKEKIVCCNIQTFVNYSPDFYCDLFDIVIIDEAHRCNEKSGQYGKVLQQMLTPIRIGFTATLPTDRKKQLMVEGLLGPVLGEFDIVEAQKEGVLAKTKVTLIPVPHDDKIGCFQSYRDIYDAGIVHNRARNKLVIKAAKRRVKKNKSVIIVVKEIEHGEELQEIAALIGLETKFVQGITEIDTRERIKNLLNNKKAKCVICTAVWKEGINIPELNAVILAGIGKGEIAVKQFIGRGTRKTKTKTKMEVVDFLDPYKYLAQHSIARLQIYAKNKWL